MRVTHRHGEEVVTAVFEVVLHELGFACKYGMDDQAKPAA